MKQDEWIGLLVLGGIIVLALMGGSKNAATEFLSPTSSTTEQQKQAQIQQQLNDTKAKVATLQKQLQAELDSKTASKYKGIVTIRNINRSTKASQEYVILSVGKTTDPIDITGWTLTSTSTGQSVAIPQSTYLFFANTQNATQDVLVESGDTIYISTGISPAGESFKVNKCSGYLAQFQTFYPGLTYNCPLPKNEDLSSIPARVANDACFDYINTFPQCRIQTKTLPLNWSYECTNFIYSKINYPSCVDTHKNDKDFYKHEWRIYLKRSEHIWKTTSRETIVLRDNEGKIVATYKY